MRQMDPIEFEHVVTDALKRRGYTNVVHTGRPGDGGVDVRGVDAAGKDVAVQVKRYAARYPVDEGLIDAFVGAIALKKADRGMFVTTSSYTEPAAQAAAKAGIELIDSSNIDHFLR